MILHAIFLPQRQTLNKGAKEYKANKLCFLRANLFCIAVSLKVEGFSLSKGVNKYQGTKLILCLKLFPEIHAEQQKSGWMNTKISIMQQCLLPEMYLMASKSSHFFQPFEPIVWKWQGRNKWH